MEKIEILTLAVRYLYQFKLLQNGWYFDFHRSKTKSGLCNFKKKKITLSSHLTIGAPEEKIRNTILHEIAHALVGYKHKHDITWKTLFLQIGGNGERKSTYDKRYTFKGCCPECKREYYSHKRKKVSCKICTSDQLLNWERIN